MDNARIQSILESYRPAEGLESDPEVRMAIELAAADPSLSALREDIEAFDRAFAQALRKVKPPPDLQQRILEAAKVVDFTADATPARSFPWQWLHAAGFGVAAAAVLFLALSFTFWNRPAAPAQPAFTPPQQALAGKRDVLRAAAFLAHSHQPAYRASDGSLILAHLRDRKAALPEHLPGRVYWSKSVACDVVQVDGAAVTVVCFQGDGENAMLLLFSFPRSEFPWRAEGPALQLHKVDGEAFATWADDERVHVLYSSAGEQNLRAALDI